MLFHDGESSCEVSAYTTQSNISALVINNGDNLCILNCDFLWLLFYIYGLVLKFLLFRSNSLMYPRFVFCITEDGTMAGGNI